jgi:hypothetical protein
MYSCGVFETRSPETPVAGSAEVYPATTSAELISNFLSAFNTRNQEAYISCLSDKNKGQTRDFEFVPSATATNRYPGMFTTWSINEETRNFKALMINIQENSKPELVFQNQKWDNSNSDSTVFLTDYQLTLFIKNIDSAEVFAGSALFVCSRETSGLWHITRWIDVDKKSALSQSSWSILKAQFAN